MNEKQYHLGEFEELVLLAILRLRDDAYGVTIRELIETEGERNVTFGALYSTLKRLLEKGFVRSWAGDPTPERGGRAKLYFCVEPTGREALIQAERTRQKIRPELEWLGGLV